MPALSSFVLIVSDQGPAASLVMILSDASKSPPFVSMVSFCVNTVRLPKITPPSNSAPPPACVSMSPNSTIRPSPAVTCKPPMREPPTSPPPIRPSRTSPAPPGWLVRIVNESAPAALAPSNLATSEFVPSVKYTLPPAGAPTVVSIVSSPSTRTFGACDASRSPPERVTSPSSRHVPLWLLSVES